jgi:hypothetical protein
VSFGLIARKRSPGAMKRVLQWSDGENVGDGQGHQSALQIVISETGALPRDALPRNSWDVATASRKPQFQLPSGIPQSLIT